MNVSLIIIGLALLLGLLLSYKWISDNTHQLFWLSFVLYFDPGGFFSGLNDGSIFWRIKYYDLFFALMMVSWSLSDLWKRKISFEQPHFRFIASGFAICSVYYLLVSGYIVPNAYGYEDFPLFIQKNRQFFYGLPVFIAVFQFTYFNFKGFVKPFIFFSLVSLIAFFITLLTGVELVPVLKLSRFGENDRISLWSYGLTNWLLPLGVIILFMKNSFSGWQRKALLFGMGLMLVTIILTLTRREFIRVFFMLFSIPLIINYISNNSLLKGYRKIAIWAIIPIVLLYLFFFNYFELASNLVSETFNMLINGGSGSNGDYRVSGEGDLVYVKQIIADHPFFGIGFYPAPWERVLDMKNSGITLGIALDASNEVPIYGSIMRLGLMGLIVPFLIHGKMIGYAFKFVTTIKHNKWLIEREPMEVFIGLSMVYYFVSLFTTDLFSLFLEYYHYPAFTLFSSIVAMLTAITARLQARITADK